MIINKEDLENYTLIHASEDRSKHWHSELNYAVRLGNEFKGKTTITFQTDQGSKTVETTIWSLTEDYIQLKGGKTIPLFSIIDIHY